MTTCSVNGIRMAYDDAGNSQDVLVLIHGHPFNRSMWRSQVGALSRSGWRVIAPDLRGYGQTTVVPGKTTLEVFATDIAALLDRLGVARFAIGGLSMGGQIAMELVRLHRSRLRALILAATFPQADTADGQRNRRVMADRLLREGMHAYAREALPSMLAPQSIATLPAVTASLLGMMDTTSPEGAAAALRGRAERPSYEAVLQNLDLPTLIIAGDADVFTTRADAEHMQALVRGSSLVWMPGVGHIPNLENEIAFNAGLIKFLDVVSSLPGVRSRSVSETRALLPVNSRGRGAAVSVGEA